MVLCTPTNDENEKEGDPEEGAQNDDGNGKEELFETQ